MSTFRGLSTKGFYLRGHNFGVEDIDLIKEDIVNHIFTRLGERVNMPAFGTRIPEMAFEPLDDETISVIREDLNKVISYETRVKLVDLTLLGDPDNNAILARIILEYIGTGLQTELALPIKVGT